MNKICYLILFYSVFNSSLKSQDKLPPEISTIFLDFQARKDYSALGGLGVQYFGSAINDSMYLLSNLLLYEILDFFDEEGFENDSIVGRCHYLIGLNLSSLGRQSEAINELRIALEVYRKYYPPDHFRMYSAYWHISEKSLLNQNLQQAYEYIDTAISLQINQKKSKKWPSSLTQLGKIYGKAGDYFLSKMAFAAARPYQTIYDNLGKSLLEEARVLRELKRPDEAIYILRLVPDKEEYQMEKYTQMAQAYSDLDMLDSAEYYFLNERSTIPINDYGTLAWHYNNLGNVYLRSERPEKAKENYELALHYFDISSNPGEKLMTLNNLSTAYHDMGYFEAAIKIHNELNASLGSERNQFTTYYHDLIYFYHKLNHRLSMWNYCNDTASLYIAYDDAIEIIRKISNERSKYLQDWSKLNHASYSRLIFGVGINICNEIAKIDHDNKPLFQMMEFMELNKATVLVDEISKKSNNFNTNITVIEKLQFYYDQIKYASELDKQLEYSDSLSKYLHKVPFQNLNSYDDEIQEHLDNTPSSYKNLSDQAIVHFFQHEDTSLTVLIQNVNGLHAHQLSSTEWYQESIDCVNSLRNSKDATFAENNFPNAIRALLNKTLNSPVEKLIILPDGILGNIPFELVTDQDGKFYLYKYRINYAFSLRALLAQEELKPNKGKVVLFAPTFSKGNWSTQSETLEFRRAGFGPLQYNVEEVNQIAEFIKATLFTQEKANKYNFLQQAEYTSILHLATHAIGTTPVNEPQILLAGNDKVESVYLSEIYNQTIRANMVVLSACETGLGKYVAGEGLMSVARGFAYAGAKSVVASLWAVNDQSTSQIMVYFYKHLKAGKPKDESLREAKLDYLKHADPPYQHPYYWAGFVLIGDSSPVFYSQQFNFLIIGLVIALLGGIIFLLKRRVWSG